MGLANTTAVVTGASTGIGRAIAVELGSRGAAVALLGRSEAGLTETRRLVTEAGGTGEAIKVDLRDVHALTAVAEQVGKGPRISVIANVAGVWHNGDRVYHGPRLHKTPVEETLEVLDVGLRAPMVLTALLLPFMVGAGDGHVINISGTFSSGGKGWLHYFVSKKALEEFTKGLADELRDQGVQVNCVCPADVATDALVKFFPEDAASALTARDIAEVVGMLLTPVARNITGQVIEVRSRPPA